MHAAPLLRPMTSPRLAARPSPTATQQTRVQQTARGSASPIPTAPPQLAPAPQLAGPGRPLPAALRSEMEGRFGAELGGVRIHDGAAAARMADQVDARAFSVGQDLVFGAGQFRPNDASGRGLIAHELVHTLQQRHAEGPLAVASSAKEMARLEAEAEAAALALATGRRPEIRARTGRPVLLRAAKNTAAPPPVPGPAPASAPGPTTAPQAAARQPAATAGPALKLPPGLNVITDEPVGIGTTELVVEVPNFVLPLEKGAGPWVQKAHDDAAAGGRLVFTPLFTGKSVAAYKEGGEDYKSIWLGRFGFKDTRGLADAFKAAAATKDAVKAALADSAVKQTISALDSKLSAAKCDIDHIVEKQMGGTSIPSNLQLLLSSKNQASGRATYKALVDIVDAVRDPAMRGDKVNKLQLRIGKATVPAGTSDPSFVIEDLLRRGEVVGSDAVKAQAEGKPVTLMAGGQGETVNIRDTGETPLDKVGKRIVPGMRLTQYKRGAAGPRGKLDTVSGELDSRAMQKSGSTNEAIVLGAKRPSGTAPAGSAASPDSAPVPAEAPVGEVRVLELDKTKFKKIAFFYPYLSPGELTKLELDEQGGLTGEGTIHPSIPLIPKLNVRFSRDELTAVAPIPASKLVSPLPSALRFTEGELSLQLSPTFVPKGRIGFEIGPSAKPLLKGDLSIKLEGGIVIAEGKLTPAGKLPGVSAAEGTVKWTSEAGWAGKVSATTTSIPRSTANVEIGFASKGGKFVPYATGGITTQVRNSVLELGASWDGQALIYRGTVSVEKPLPLVDRVRLSGRFSDRGLWMEGEAAVVWQKINATMKVGYARKEEEEEGRFSGSVTVAIKTEKADGSIALSFDEEGRYWGKGTVSYQLTKSLRPTLGVELTRDRRVKLMGEVALSDIALTRMWPAPAGGKIDIIKGLGIKFSIPTPIPAITAYGEIKGSLGIGYGVGPVTLRAVVFKGELYPLEDDPKVAAHLTGTFAVPAYGELYGTFGAYIGVEVALGAVGAKGGIEVTPKLRIEGEGGIKVDADYDRDGFSFEALAYAKGRLVASAKVDLVADLYAAWGLFSHTWTYNVASASAQLGPEMMLTLGKIAYAKNGEITWPSISQIKPEPENIDPLNVVKEMLGRGKATEK